MTSPRVKERQPVLPITENHSNGGGLLSPRQREGTNNAVTTVIPHGEAKEVEDEDPKPVFITQVSLPLNFFSPFHNYSKFIKTH